MELLIPSKDAEKELRKVRLVWTFNEQVFEIFASKKEDWTEFLITREDFITIMLYYNQGASRKDLEELFDFFDKTKSQKMSYGEFKKVMNMEIGKYSEYI